MFPIDPLIHHSVRLIPRAPRLFAPLGTRQGLPECTKCGRSVSGEDFYVARRMCLVCCRRTPEAAAPQEQTFVVTKVAHGEIVFFDSSKPVAQPAKFKSGDRVLLLDCNYEDRKWRAAVGKIATIVDRKYPCETPTPQRLVYLKDSNPEGKDEMWWKESALELLPSSPAVDVSKIIEEDEVEILDATKGLYGAGMPLVTGDKGRVAHSSGDGTCCVSCANGTAWFPVKSLRKLGR